MFKRKRRKIDREQKHNRGMSNKIDNNKEEIHRVYNEENELLYECHSYGEALDMMNRKNGSYITMDLIGDK